jgi:hypothetical protein
MVRVVIAVFVRALPSALLGLALAAPALAQQADETSEPDSADAEPESESDASPNPAKQDGADAKSEPEDDDLGHGGQFALRAALVLGYRMVFRYDDSPLCREYDLSKTPDDQAKFCGHGAPLALDLGLSFAPLDFIEPYLWARFGLAEEKETRTAPVVILGAGARIYTMSDSAFKIYVEPAVGVELENGSVTGSEYKKDFVFHLAAGPQLDVAPNFGLFVDGGLTLGILRSLHSSLELKAGLQARFQ